jgi:hypothetical protein
MFENTRDVRRSIRDQARALKLAVRQAEREKAFAMKEAERAQAHAIKEALKYELNCTKAGLESMYGCGNASSSRPISVEDVIIEMDSYISYLEDLPKEKVAPHEAKLEQMGEHLAKLRGSFHQ